MNVRLSKSLGWSSGLVYQEGFFINHYDVDLTMMTVSSQSDQQNIAYERLKYWIGHVLDNAVLIAQDHPKVEQWHATGARVMTFPDEPVDQIIGIMLYLKLNAIMENRLVVTATEIRSTVGDEMGYTHSHGENLGPLCLDGWWSDNRPLWADSRPRGQDKIVSLDRFPEWKDFSLDWQDTKPNPSNTVVFADFTKNEN